MFEVKFLIPVADNDGNEFSASHHQAFKARATRLFGGVTIYPGRASGVWSHEGRIYEDESILAGVAVRSLGDWSKVIELEEFAKAHYRQLAVCLQYLGQLEIL